MPGSVNNLEEPGPAPLDSSQVSDLDATMNRLTISSKRHNNSDSTSTTTTTSNNPDSESVTDCSAPDKSSSDGVLENLVNSVDQFLREALQNPRERLSGVCLCCLSLLIFLGVF